MLWTCFILVIFRVFRFPATNDALNRTFFLAVARLMKRHPSILPLSQPQLEYVTKHKLDGTILSTDAKSVLILLFLVQSAISLVLDWGFFEIADENLPTRMI